MLSFASCILINLIYITTANTLYNVTSWTTKIPANYPLARTDIDINVRYPNTTTNTVKFPLLVFGHCLFGKERYYDYVWQSVVPNGYIYIQPRRMDDDKEQKQLARELRVVLDWVRDNCTDCPFKDIIGDKTFISGHSMGAGAAIFCLGNYWLGQAFKYQFDAGMTLSACGAYNNSMFSAAKNITVPTLLLDGSHDCIAPTDEWADIFYNNIPNDSKCKYETIITNATHCNFAEFHPAEDISCLQLEEGMCPAANMTGYIPESQQLQITMEYMNLFLNATMYEYKNPNPFGALNQKIQNDIKNGIVTSRSNNCH